MEVENKCDTVGVKANRFRTIQIHPTLKCNLACLHCYSSSSPQHRDMLDIDSLKNFLEYAYSQGFNNISVSGGEPFLYKDLKELLVFSKKIGFQNSLASNGMLLQSEKNREILEYVDLIAISVDGKEDLHDHIRAQKGAFKKMLQGVQILKDMNKAFGFIHTVTPESWDSLIWLGEFVEEHGGKLLQLHPLEMHGRATEQMGSSEVDDTLAHQIYILANYLTSKYADKMVVQLDLLHRDYLKEFPQIVSGFVRQCSNGGQLSDILDNIIIEETGRILPISYGFDSEFTIGNINSFDENMFEKFIDNKVPSLKRIYENTLTKIVKNKDLDIINWNELLVNESHIFQQETFRKIA